MCISKGTEVPWIIHHYGFESRQNLQSLKLEKTVPATRSNELSVKESFKFLSASLF